MAVVEPATRNTAKIGLVANHRNTQAQACTSMLLLRLAVGVDTGGADAAGFSVTDFDPSLSPSASTTAARGAWACGLGEEETPEMEDMLIFLGRDVSLSARACCSELAAASLHAFWNGGTSKSAHAAKALADRRCVKKSANAQHWVRNDDLHLMDWHRQ